VHKVRTFPELRPELPSWWEGDSLPLVKMLPSLQEPFQLPALLLNGRYLVCFQVRRLICKRLASLLSMRSTMEPANIEQSRKCNPGNYHHSSSDDDQAAENSGSNNRALTKILDLLETRILIEDEDRQKSDKAAKMKGDWMLAAAVIDRLCFIVLLVIFIGGTCVFISLFLQS